MQGWFLPPGGGGGVGLGSFFRRGNLYWYTFSMGDSIPGRFFRGEVLCEGKLYATTPDRQGQSCHCEAKILLLQLLKLIITFVPFNFLAYTF